MERSEEASGQSSGEAASSRQRVSQPAPGVVTGWGLGAGIEQNRGRHTQPVAGSPKGFPEDSTMPYGVGAFLLASGSAMQLVKFRWLKELRCCSPARARKASEWDVTWPRITRRREIYFSKPTKFWDAP